MLSILIPTFNYTIFPLVEVVFLQCKSLSIEFEIICIDDGSTLFHKENLEINKLENCHYSILEKNSGRSAIRNLLAQKAKFNWLLFLDADVFIDNPNFISNYVNCIDNQIKIVNGGIKYQKEKPKKEFLFRWIYGVKRESKSKVERDKNVYLSFLTLNFLIHKSIFKLVSFNETIPNLRHEDTLFSYDLMKSKIAIQNIHNEVIHNGLDNFEIAIKKENNSLIALKYLLDNQLLDSNYLKLATLYVKIKSLKLDSLVSLFYRIFGKMICKNLSGFYPSLFLFDLYRISYFCNLNQK